MLGQFLKHIRGRNTPIAPGDGDVDLASDDFFKDPYPCYAALRAERPVAPVIGGGYILTRHADISDALRNPALGNAPSRFSALHTSKRATYPAADLAFHILPFMDPPRHTDVRRRIGKVFGALAKTFESDIVEIAADLLQQAPAGDRLDAIDDLATPFSVKAMCAFVGLPANDAEFLRQWSERFFYLFAPIRNPELFARVNDDVGNMRAYFLDRVTAPIDGVGHGLIGALRAAVDGDPALSVREIADNALLMFADGVENVRYGVGTVLLSLTSYGRDIGDLTDVTAARTVTAEALRLNTPAQTIPRVVITETRLGGMTVQTGTPIFLALGSANRDPAVFENPDTFDPSRDLSKAITFGAGRHACIGGRLAETLITAFMTALSTRGFQVVTAPSDVTYEPRFGHRWPARVDIRINE